MEFTSKMNGKKFEFFIKLDNEKEFALLQPYFIVTSSDKPRKGNILSMNCLFSGCVWYGYQRHGYGYARCADVYNTLIDIIYQLHKKDIAHGNKLDLALKNWNTHNEKVTFSDEILTELEHLNEIALMEKWEKM